MYFGTSTACVVAPSREGASPLPFGPQNKKLGNRCHNFILEILRPCAPYMAAIVTLFWGFDFSDLHFCFDNSKGSGIAKQNTDDERHVEWAEICVCSRRHYKYYTYTLLRRIWRGSQCQKKKKLRPLYRWPFAWRIQISHFLKHLIPPLLHVLLHRQ